MSSADWIGAILQGVLLLELGVVLTWLLILFINIVFRGK